MTHGFYQMFSPKEGEHLSTKEGTKTKLGEPHLSKYIRFLLVLKAWRQIHEADYC